MKATLTELLEFNKQIGLDVEIVEEGSEFDKDALLSAVDSNRKAILKPLIEEEVKSTITESIAGKTGGALRSALSRKTGMARRALDEFKTDDEAIEAAINHKIGLLEGEKAETSKKIEEILSNHQKDIESKQSEFDTKLKEANEKYIRRDMIASIRKKLEEVPLPKGANKEIIAEDVYNHLASKHDLSYDETKGEIALFKKGSPTMPVLNASNNQFVTVIDEAKDFLTPRGLWETDMSNRNPAEEMAGKGGDLNTPPKQPSLTNSPADKKAAFMAQMKALENSGI